MFVNGKVALWYRTGVKHATDYATEAADGKVFPGGVCTCTLSYAQTAHYVAQRRYIRVGHFIMQNSRYCAEIPFPHSTIACGYLRIGYSIWPLVRQEHV